MSTLKKGRPIVAFGIWPEMVQAAGSVRGLAAELDYSCFHLQGLMQGRRNTRGSHRKLAQGFARSHDINPKIYSHPIIKGCFFLSDAAGWWIVNPGAGKTPLDTLHAREPWPYLLRKQLENLEGLELQFGIMWECLTRSPSN